MLASAGGDGGLAGESSTGDGSGGDSGGTDSGTNDGASWSDANTGHPGDAGPLPDGAGDATAPADATAADAVAGDATAGDAAVVEGAPGDASGTDGTVTGSGPFADAGFDGAYGQCSSGIDAGAGVAAVVYSDDFDTNPAYNGITGTWAVDNSLFQAGTRSIHPPMQAAGSVAEMATTCGDAVHSELSFYYSAANPAAGQSLSFYIDDVLYSTYGNTYNYGYYWNKVDVVVPTGTHRYRWDSATPTAGQPPYWIDTIQCKNTPITPNTTGMFYFEDGFVPPEFAGSFRIDNSLPQAGTFSARPWILGAGQTSSVYFSCGCRAHSEISFYYSGVNPTAGQKLQFYVDGALYGTYGNTYNYAYYWGKVDVVLPMTGTHEYRWDTSTDVAGQPPYWIDTIQCQ